MYKLIAIDLDGTLLNSYGEISLRNKQAIQQAMDKEIQVILASGRMPSSIKNFCQEIKANRYLIAGNGTLIYDTQEEKIVYDCFMEKEKVLNIINICEENSIYYSIYTENSIITKGLNYNVLYYQYENSKKPEYKKTKINLVEDVYKYIDEINTMPLLKMTVCDSDQVIFNGIIRRLRQIPDIDVLDIEHMSRKVIKTGTKDVNIEYFYTEITNLNVNKWNALQVIMNKLEVKPEEVIAIGDNMNDKEMIENAGVGVAMGKSALSMMKIGDMVVADNNSDGVAEAIEKCVLH